MSKAKEEVHPEDEALAVATTRAEKARKVREADAHPPEVGDVVTMSFTVTKVQMIPLGGKEESGFKVTLQALEADGVEPAALPQITCNHKLVATVQKAADKK